MFYKIYRDIANYFIVRKAIKKAEKNAQWEKYGLRRDWVYRTYTVINPSKFDLGDEDIVMKAKIIEKTKPINAFINSMGISDLVAVSIEKIPNSESYLLVYYPLFNYLTVWKITAFFLVAITLIAGIFMYI